MVTIVVVSEGHRGDAAMIMAEAYDVWEVVHVVQSSTGLATKYRTVAFGVLSATDHRHFHKDHQ